MPLSTETDGLAVSSPLWGRFPSLTAMALNLPYLAAENSAAERRSRALHRFIVASPILLLLAVGLVGHRRHAPFSGPAANEDFDRRVLAYRDRVVAAEALPQDEFPPLGPYLTEARRWNAGLDAGDLTPLIPAAYEDHLRDDVRGEIFRCGIAVASGLTLASERCLKAGQPVEASADALVAARLSNGIRGFELQACLQALLSQRRAIGVVARAWPSLSHSERITMRNSLAALWIDPHEVEGLATREKAQLKDYVRRQRGAIGERDMSVYEFGDQAVVAIRRSVRLSNERIAALLKGDEPATTKDLF